MHAHRRADGGTILPMSRGQAGTGIAGSTTTGAGARPQAAHQPCNPLLALLCETLEKQVAMRFDRALPGGEVARGLPGLRVTRTVTRCLRHPGRRAEAALGGGMRAVPAEVGGLPRGAGAVGRNQPQAPAALRPGGELGAQAEGDEAPPAGRVPQVTRSTRHRTMEQCGWPVAPWAAQTACSPSAPIFCRIQRFSSFHPDGASDSEAFSEPMR